MHALTAGREEDFTTSRVPAEELLPTLQSVEVFRHLMGETAERAFRELAAEDWEDLASILDISRDDLSKLNAHMGQHYRPSPGNEDFDPDELVSRDRSSFSYTIPSDIKQRNSPSAIFVGARVPGLFGAVCDRDVPYFVSQEAKKQLFKHSVNVMDDVERAANSLIYTASLKGHSRQAIAEACNTSVPETEQRLRYAEPLAIQRAWANLGGTEGPPPAPLTGPQRGITPNQ